MTKAPHPFLGIGIAAVSFLGCAVYLGTAAALPGRTGSGPPPCGTPRGEGFTWHFVVVVGLNSRRERIAALDPAVGLMSDSIAGLENEWRPTKGVTLGVFLPEKKPVLAMFDGMESGGAR